MKRFIFTEYKSWNIDTKPIAGEAALKLLGRNLPVTQEIYTKPIAGEAALKPPSWNFCEAIEANTKPIAGEAALKPPAQASPACGTDILNPLQAKQH